MLPKCSNTQRPLISTITFRQASSCPENPLRNKFCKCNVLPNRFRETHCKASVVPSYTLLASSCPDFSCFITGAHFKRSLVPFNTPLAPSSPLVLLLGTETFTPWISPSILPTPLVPRGLSKPQLLPRAGMCLVLPWRPSQHPPAWMEHMAGHMGC